MPAGIDPPSPGAVKMSEALAEAPENAPSSPGLELLWGVRLIAKTVGRTERAMFYILENNHIPAAKKVGGRWVVSRAALRKFFEAA
jgi:hypothetical protein